MKIAIGSDHAGFLFKQEIARFLTDRQIEVKDFGPSSTNAVDYPDIGLPVAEAVAGGAFEGGILICGSGIGMSITANKVPGIRAALCHDTFCAKFSRVHNNANVLVLGERNTPLDKALEIVDTWVSTTFPNEERHARRIQKISDIEKKYFTGGR